MWKSEFSFCLCFEKLMQILKLIWIFKWMVIMQGR